jgi:anti-sigma factor ChrR (cupin superfamily)
MRGRQHWCRGLIGDITNVSDDEVDDDEFNHDYCARAVSCMMILHWGRGMMLTQHAARMMVHCRAAHDGALQSCP